EKIDHQLESKKSLYDLIIQSENWISELSENELEEIFTLNASDITGYIKQLSEIDSCLDC
ncbi:hypothetical protein, partial [Bacillus paralicheniformis]|uniref:hypothetical protein n=1 Tax=Bacillus paralicheniformis TaxID=1648923 RepID=UPI002DBE24EA